MPFSQPSVTYTLVNGQVSDAAIWNTNYQDIIDALTDGTKELSVGQLITNGGTEFQYNDSNFTGTLTGVTTTPTAVIYWAKIGRIVTLRVNATDLGLSGTSDGGGTVTITGMPADIRPNANTFTTNFPSVLANGSSYEGFFLVATTGIMTVYYRNAVTSYTNVFPGAGNVAVQPFCVTYLA